MEETQTTSTTSAGRIAELEAALAAVTRARDLLRASHERLRLELELLKRRIFVAKAERVDTTQLELELAVKLAELDRLADTVRPAAEARKMRKRARPKGRRDLRTAPLPEERVEITDPLYEGLCTGYERTRHTRRRHARSS